MRFTYTIFFLGASFIPQAQAQYASEWSGLYGSVRMGYSIKSDANNKPIFTESDAIKMKGFGQGLSLGFTHQFDRYVVGTTLEIAARNVKGSAGAYDVVTARGEANFTGQIGYLVTPKIHLYGLVGITAANFEFRKPITDAREAQSALGVIIGAGIERRFQKNWSVFSEYRFNNFKTVTFNNFHMTVAPNAHDVRAGVNYRF